MALLRSQKAEIFETIKQRGFDPREFVWSERPVALPTGRSGLGDRLTHTQSGFYFEFASTGSETGHFASYAPGDSTPKVKTGTGSWLRQMGIFRSWLGYAKREIEAPPLWEQLAAGEPLLEVSVPPGTDDRPFSATEGAAIAASIEEVRAYVRKELPAGSIPRVEEQLARLEASAKTAGRVSWMQAAVGMAVGLVWTGLMAPDQARAMLDILGKAFQHLLGA